MQEIRTTCQVPAGTELTHSFVNLALPTSERQVHLQSVYGFKCACARCTAAPSLSGDSAVVLAASAIPTSVEGYEVASVALAQQGGQQGGQDLVASAQTDKHAELDAAVRAVDSALQAAAECEDEAAEVEVLKRALQTACAALHPLHSKLGDLHSALQQVCMVVGDMAAAAQHAAFLAVQFRFALSACRGIESVAHTQSNQGEDRRVTLPNVQFRRIGDISPAPARSGLPPHPLMALQAGALLELLHAAQPSEDSVQWTFQVPPGGEWMQQCLPSSIRELFDLNAGVMQIVYGWHMLRRPGPEDTGTAEACK